MSQEREFAAYLKEKTELLPLMEALRSMWLQHDSWRGKLILNDCSQDLAEALLDLGIQIQGKKTIQLSYAQWKKGLEGSRFEDCDLKETLKCYFNQEIVGKKVLQQQHQSKRKAQFEALLQNYQGTLSYDWITQKKKQEPRFYQRLIKEDHALIKQVFEALNALPIKENKVVLLTVFSTQLFSDPHALDEGKCRSLLIQGIRWWMNHEDPFAKREADWQVLEWAGLLRDTVSNRCLGYNLIALKKGEMDPGWLGFALSRQPLCITLYHVLNSDALKTKQRLILIENPSVFEQLVHTLQKKDKDSISLLCTEGQPALCVWMLLSRVDFEHTRVYYCGDFDPEGLQMAQQMLQRYPAIRLWHYTEQDYNQAKSTKTFDSRRRSILENCTHEALRTIQTLMLKQGCCGYQEALLEQYQKLDFPE